jgi:hypothetical protein
VCVCVYVFNYNLIYFLTQIYIYIYIDIYIHLNHYVHFLHFHHHDAQCNFNNSCVCYINNNAHIHTKVCKQSEVYYIGCDSCDGGFGEL